MTTILDSALTMPRTCVAADQVIALDSVGSTNTYAAELVRKGALFGSTSRDGLDGCDGRDWTGREIVAICADEQTAGRGRLDHQWTSAVGESFIVSLVVSVPTAIVRDTSVNGWLQMIAGCEARNAIIAAIRDCGGPLGKDIVLKWPSRRYLTDMPTASRSNGRTTFSSTARNWAACSPKWFRLPQLPSRTVQLVPLMWLLQRNASASSSASA